MSVPIGDPRPAGESGPAGDQRQAGEEGPAGDPRPAGEAAPGNGDAGYDPADHKVAEVIAHLDTVDDAERTRILNAEATGKNRTGITG